MTPKEKSLEIFEKYLTPNLVSPMYGVLSYSEAKQCALIAANEILDVLDGIFSEQEPYWKQVKVEIEKL